MRPVNKSTIHFRTAVIAVGAFLFSFTSVDAVDKKTQLKLGEMEYMSSCASCHGKDAKGNGSVADSLFPSNHLI